MLRIVQRSGNQKRIGKYLAVSLILIFISLTSVIYGIELEKRDYLALIIGNYVHGFKEFETSVTTSADSVSIGIYYDLSTQDEKRAVQLANRFRENIPKMINKYLWAKGVVVQVNIYSEDRTGRGY